MLENGGMCQVHKTQRTFWHGAVKGGSWRLLFGSQELCQNRNEWPTEESIEKAIDLVNTEITPERDNKLI